MTRHRQARDKKATAKVKFGGVHGTDSKSEGGFTWVLKKSKGQDELKRKERAVEREDVGGGGERPKFHPVKEKIPYSQRSAGPAGGADRNKGTTKKDRMPKQNPTESRGVGTKHPNTAMN